LLGGAWGKTAFKKNNPQKLMANNIFDGYAIQWYLERVS